MYESKVKYYYGTGRRKHSVARVRLYPGNGSITINGRSIDEYFGLDTLKLIVRQPLNLTEIWTRWMLSALLQAAVLPVRLVRSVTASPVRCWFTARNCVRF